MRIAGLYFLPLARGRAYEALQDADVLVRCLPDFESLERVSEHEYVVTMRLAFAKLAGAFSGAFSGTIRIVEAKPPVSFRIVVEGDVLLAAVKGDGLISLRSVEDGTELTYDGDLRVGGAIAALGQRVIDSTAKTMIGKFFGRFVQEAKR